MSPQPKPRVRIGCRTVDHLGRESVQYCTGCAVRDDNLKDKAFSDECEAVRFAMNASSIWNGTRKQIPAPLPKAAKASRDAIVKADTVAELYTAAGVVLECDISRGRSA